MYRYVCTLSRMFPHIQQYCNVYPSAIGKYFNNQWSWGCEFYNVRYWLQMGLFDGLSKTVLNVVIYCQHTFLKFSFFCLFFSNDHLLWTNLIFLFNPFQRFFPFSQTEICFIGLIVTIKILEQILNIKEKDMGWIALPTSPFSDIHCLRPDTI